MSEQLLFSHSLCDAISGLASQADDIAETVGALLQLCAKFADALDRSDLANASERGLADYAMRLANAEARAEGLALSLRAVQAERARLEESSAILQQMLRNRSLEALPKVGG